MTKQSRSARVDGISSRLLGRRIGADAQHMGYGVRAINGRDGAAEHGPRNKDGGRTRETGS